MAENPPEQRHSRALEAPLIANEIERAKAKARNGLRQYDRTIEQIEYWFYEPDRPFRLRVSHILDLRRVALEGISAYAGNFRPGGVSYILWRLNWIHPFADGNGRTSRAVSYLVLSVRTGYRLPGRPMIPEQIVANRTPYFEALEVADDAVTVGRFDLTAMEALIERLLAARLLSVIRQAGGTIKET